MKHEGMLYGFSWGVVSAAAVSSFSLSVSPTPLQVKTLAMADVSRWEIQMDVLEDDRLGELMVSKTTCRLAPWLTPPPPVHSTTSLRNHPTPPSLPTETVRTTAAFLGPTKTT